MAAGRVTTSTWIKIVNARMSLLAFLNHGGTGTQRVRVFFSVLRRVLVSPWFFIQNKKASQINEELQYN